MRNAFTGDTFQEHVTLLFLSMMDVERKISRIEIEADVNNNFDDIIISIGKDKYSFQIKDYENISLEIILALREHNIDVYSIYESNRGITDEEVIRLSIDPPRIILTEDKDFGEWVFSHNIEKISVLFLRYSYNETTEIINILISLLVKKKINLFSKFSTITTKKIRIREI